MTNDPMFFTSLATMLDAVLEAPGPETIKLASADPDDRLCDRRSKHPINEDIRRQPAPKIETAALAVARRLERDFSISKMLDFYHPEFFAKPASRGLQQGD